MIVRTRGVTGTRRTTIRSSLVVSCDLTRAWRRRPSDVTSIGRPSYLSHPWWQAAQ
jgi:hypothetical protein